MLWIVTLVSRGIKNACQFCGIKGRDRYLVLSMFSSAVDLSLMSLEVEFSVLASPVISEFFIQQIGRANMIN